jgi:hypothetical protein
MGHAPVTARPTRPALRLTVAALLASVACFNPTAPDAIVNKPFELKAGASTMLADGTRMTFEAVRADSRCPIDANCIVAGDATVAISLSQSGRAAESRELHTDPNRSQVTYDPYVIKLTELQPYPRSGRNTDAADYVATFVVSVR